jgi:hypothetical protein
VRRDRQFDVITGRSSFHQMCFSGKQQKKREEERKKRVPARDKVRNRLQHRQETKFILSRSVCY